MGHIPARTPAPGAPAIKLTHVVEGVNLSQALGLIQPVEDCTASSIPAISSPVFDPLPAIEQSAVQDVKDTAEHTSAMAELDTRCSFPE
jgi:hypothetical protein